jgi:hypothetical protein
MSGEQTQLARHFGKSATSHAPATAGKKRIAGSESPKSDRAIRVINAISGGWST